MEDETAAENTTRMAGEEGDEAGNEEGLEEAPVERVEEGGADEHATPELVGVAWSVETLGGADLAPDTEATLEFAEDGNLAGQASCNRFFGTYEQTDEGLTITPGGTTRMACPEEVMAQEQAFLKALAEVTDYQIDPDGTLILMAEGDEVLRARAPQP